MKINIVFFCLLSIALLCGCGAQDDAESSSGSSEDSSDATTVVPNDSTEVPTTEASSSETSSSEASSTESSSSSSEASSSSSSEAPTTESSSSSSSEASSTESSSSSSSEASSTESSSSSSSEASSTESSSSSSSEASSTESSSSSSSEASSTESSSSSSSEASSTESSSSSSSEAPTTESSSSSSSEAPTSSSSSSTTTTEEPYQWHRIFSPQVMPVQYFASGFALKAGEVTWRAFFKISNDNNTIYCGGAILSYFKVITTASCIYDFYTGEIYPNAVMSVGGRRSDTASYSVKVDFATQATVHPEYKYNDPYMQNNLAIITTIRPLPFSEVVGKIEIASLPSSYNDKMRMVGFGRDVSGQPLVNLKYHFIRFVSNSKCLALYGPDVCSQSSVLTSVGQDTSKATICRVESGAPISYHPGWWSSPKLIALASFISEDGCVAGSLDGHVYLIKQYNWINEVLLN
ncbi:trypsin-like serine protease-like protein [Tomelloso virus]|uniref:Trypsin-like serine protease-like protein n=1 Tax=Tomelloso virus TaxID=2053981 RepID=A0A2H4T2P2_9VIRU|nr:trypsin-like serine protease-like protein [Tomelloso virus]ATY70193.1 trypsin-like serine protease-like protein [Tomelloso virus]